MYQYLNTNQFNIRRHASPQHLTVMALELEAAGVGESFKVKPPDHADLEVCLKGVTSMCSRWSARLAVKCRRGTFDLLVSHGPLLIEVVSRRHMTCPRSCSLHGGASNGLHYIVVAPSSHVGCCE
jgi:hypothetical protein